MTAEEIKEEQDQLKNMFSDEQLEAFKALSKGKRKPKQFSTSTTQMTGMHPLKKELNRDAKPKAAAFKPKK